MGGGGSDERKRVEENEGWEGRGRTGGQAADGCARRQTGLGQGADSGRVSSHVSSFAGLVIELQYHDGPPRCDGAV